jgi:hypothetical protein
VSDPTSVDPDAAAQQPAEFSIAFGQRRRMVALLRRFVMRFYDEVVQPRIRGAPESAWASRLSLAAHELVENAVQYGPHGDATFSIRIDPDPADPGARHVVRMTTRNRADADQRETVRQSLDAINGADDAFVYYMSLMRESVLRNEGSGLGLARVRVEADMEIDCAIDGDEIEIAAEARIITDTGSDDR